MKNNYQELDDVSKINKKVLVFSKNFSKISFISLMVIATANAIPLANESDVTKGGAEGVIIEDELRNDSGELLREEEIKALKNSYISPYNYLQDPIALNMGYDSRTDSAAGTYHGGFSVIAGQNRPLGQNSMTMNTDIAQIWGQTGRLGGFAIGGGAVAVFNVNDGQSVDIYTTTGQLALNQAYINYQYSNKFDITAGNILISTPWVSSFGSSPGATYAMGNNTYQGALFNIQALPSLLITGFSAFRYLQYPNNWYTAQNYYNTMGGPLANNQSTAGTSGIGLTWNPVNSYTGKLWFYNFADYANMAYVDNAYHLGLSNIVSMDFGLQAFSQSSAGRSITNNQAALPSGIKAGYISSNGYGLKMALNIANNTTSINFNNIIGRDGSFLNGGMVTPYSYGLEVDPLYTTPALTSLAELGSGFAYTIRNTTAFMDKSLNFNLSMSQFFVNQAYATQNTQVTEYDASLLYRISNTNMNVWARMVYLQQSGTQGIDILQPRIIFNWSF